METNNNTPLATRRIFNNGFMEMPFFTPSVTPQSSVCHTHDTMARGILFWREKDYYLSFQSSSRGIVLFYLKYFVFCTNASIFA